MASVMSTTDKAALTVKLDVLSDVAVVVGRARKGGIGSFGFAEVFNCLSTLHRISATNPYIANEAGQREIQLSPLDSERLVRFAGLITLKNLQGLSTNQRERDSVQSLFYALRGIENGYNR